jgi:Putative amidase domain
VSGLLPLGAVDGPTSTVEPAGPTLSARRRTVTYDREAAAAYALRYWNRVCHDGWVGVKSHTGQAARPIVKAEPGSSIYAMGIVPAGMGEGDCTHFVSCCIGKAGGGLSLGNWHAPPAYGFLNAPALLRFLIVSGRADVVPAPDGAQVVRDAEHAWWIVRTHLRRGDIVAYRGAAEYEHLALLVGDGETAGQVACHSAPRCGTTFDAVGCIGFTGYTFLRIL